MKTYICRFTYKYGNGYALINTNKISDIEFILINQGHFEEVHLADCKEADVCINTCGPLIITAGNITTVGSSAYDLAVASGFVGTLDEWLESLKGEQGLLGILGETGEKGDPFTYNDFTEELKLHIIDSATSASILLLQLFETPIQDAERQRKINEGLRLYAETRRDLNFRLALQQRQSAFELSLQERQNTFNAVIAQAENVNATINGTILKVTDRNGVIKTVDTKGEQGNTGPKGDKGDLGEKGDTGALGEKGDKGDTGDTGLTGPQGPKGDKGDKGDTGPQGIQGEKGDKGDKGDTGTNDYNDLINKPTNVSTFNNDAGYLVSTDIVNKLNKLSVQTVTYSNLEPVLSALLDTYYNILGTVNTYVITLPTVTDITHTNMIVFMFTTGTTPSVTFSTAADVIASDGFSIEAESTYEINAIFNGTKWILASLLIDTNDIRAVNN